MAGSEEQFLSLEVVAGRLQVSDQTVRRWVKAGKLAAYKPGLEYRIKGGDLEEFLKTREVHPKVLRRSPSEPSFNDVLADERRAGYQRSWRDFITLKANQIASEADSKGYAPEWMAEISSIPRDITNTLFDNGVLGKRETYPTEAEYRQSWEISDALEELKQAVEQAWRAQIRESDQLERQREAAAKLDSIWKRNKEADKSNKDKLEAIRDERSESA